MHSLWSIFIEWGRIQRIGSSARRISKPRWSAEKIGRKVPIRCRSQKVCAKVEKTK